MHTVDHPEEQDAVAREQLEELEVVDHLAVIGAGVVLDDDGEHVDDDDARDLDEQSWMSNHG
eukprot:3409799-Prymnesium_polylepis.2